jgi:hypothetical protein
MDEKTADVYMLSMLDKIKKAVVPYIDEYGMHITRILTDVTTEDNGEVRISVDIEGKKRK